MEREAHHSLRKKANGVGNPYIRPVLGSIDKKERDVSCFYNKKSYYFLLKN
jgi:hypothetical protein